MRDVLLAPWYVVKGVGLTLGPPFILFVGVLVAVAYAAALLGHWGKVVQIGAAIPIAVVALVTAYSIGKDGLE